MLAKFTAFGLCLLLAACGGALPAPPQTPVDASRSPAPAPASQPTTAAEKQQDTGQPPTGVPSPGAECQAFVGEAAASCGGGAFDERLAGALGLEPSERDRALRCLERAPDAPPGWVRALRADLAPRGCADAVIGTDTGATGVARDLADALVALAAGARLYRTVRQPPLPRPPFSKPDFLKHFKEVLSPWIATQAHAVDVLSRLGPRLSGYARGVVALEAGLADMRFVGVARAIDLPAEMKSDPDIRETYLVALEQALEPRVARGRDAALVGLGELSRQGITNDARLRDARQLLSELYAGRRVDALDRLLLPALPPLEQTSVAEKLAAQLPAFYMLKLESKPQIEDPKLLRARLEQGVPPALWLDEPQTQASPELLQLEQRALFQLGQMYFWAEPFARAAAIAPPAGDVNAGLITELAKTLSRGPRNAAALMLGPPTLPPELGQTSGVDALAKQKGPVAGLAEFDAAYLRQLAPPADDPAFWRDEAQRYARARTKLPPKEAKLAREFESAAADTEKALRQAGKRPSP